MKRLFTILMVMTLLIGVTGSMLLAKPKKKVPGIDVMRKHGTKLDAEGILDRIGDSMSNLPAGAVAYAIYQEVLSLPNIDPVYVIDSITYDKKGMATDIQGHVVTPATFRGFIRMGGLGTPVYEAVEPNEFGVIFGRAGNIAIRDGVIVKVNPLDEAEIYELLIGSETYDIITRASILYQAYAAIRVPYLQNMAIELEGMLLNSASKDAILKGIKDFKKKNKKMNDTELMINFLKANKSYLTEIKGSNNESRARIRESRKFMDACASACALQTVDLVKHFAKMAATITALSISMNPVLIVEETARYIADNVPKNMNLKMNDLNQMQAYGKYQMNEYNKNQKKNAELWKSAMDILKEIN